MTPPTPPAAHPRRRPAKDDPNSLADSLQNMSIRKDYTFHPATNTNQSSPFWDPLESNAPPPMAVRSTTSPQSLEDLLLGSGERRIAQLFNRVDQAIAANSKIALGNVLSEPEVLPVPTFTVNSTTLSDPPQKTRTHSHSSDSGIGSSVYSMESESTAKQSVRSAPAAVNPPLSGISDAADDERGLSKYAADQIYKYIIKPILAEESLKEFHELIESVPCRIGDKEIKTLRDLERTLIFLAPDYSRSPSKYLQFCERTIRVLHTTVTTIHESDQKAPADRPYTQNYFLDLVQQIRRYATILAVTREKQAKGGKVDEMDITKDGHVSLRGGMSQNGKPAELVHHTADGKVVSLATGRAVPAEELASDSMGLKRAAGLDVDEEEALRSMARRKKNAKPEIHTCELCDKEFKRPCDLTKHVKTHERPWKCSTEDCKYYEYGWPTEKERDRHVNDKHSSTPSLYHCLYKPCPYTSKRESNCKQHMEKAHGWDYQRSKSNGKGRVSVTRLNQGSIPPSPASTALTPLTPIAPSPSMHSLSNSSRHSSMAPPPTAGPSSYGTPRFGTPALAQPSPDFYGHFNMNMTWDFNDMHNFPTSSVFPITPAMSEERCASESLSSYSGLQYDGSNFDDASPNDFALNGFDMDYDFKSYTPNSSIAGPSSAAAPYTSPSAQMDHTFTNDAMNLDYDYGFSTGPTEDFTLFGATAPGASTGDMFPTLTTESSWGNLDLASNFGAHLDTNTAGPQLPTGNSTLDELFPELKDQR